MLTDEDVINEEGGIDISVVIPSYNHARYIKEAIDSVLGQTFRNWELIVIDDGSTDGTRALLDKAYAGHSQIRLTYQANQGAHHAINQGMSLAKGRYISILNSDDVYHPERLHTLLKHCESSPCALAFTRLTPIDALGAPIVDVHHPWCLLYDRLIREYSHGGARQALLTGNFTVTTSNFFFRADLLQTCGRFRKKRYNHDWDFMARLVRQGLEIACVGDKPLLSYRLHNQNTITQNTLMARLELKQILHSLVPPRDLYLAKLLTSIQTNLRSIRREHQARIVQQVRSGYDNHIQNMLTDLQAQHAANTEQLHAANQALAQENQTLSINRQNLLQQNALLEQHLTQIQNSRLPVRAAPVNGGTKLQEVVWANENIKRTMIVKRFIRVLWRATRDPLYRKEVIGRIRQKIDNGTLYSWLWSGIQRRFRPVKPVLMLATGQYQSIDTARDYTQALRFNQAPHPQWHLPRTRVAPHAKDVEGSSPRFIAYYLPQFHPFAVNNKAWGEGFTEWTNTTKALPQYKGHYQPHLPADLGHYDLRLPDVMRQQIDIAKSYGVNGFCFHYYWFDGQKVMDLPLNQFLAHPDMDQSFCICWANEHWTRRWDGMESEVILHQSYSHEKCIEFIHDVLPILQDPRYIRVEGKPLLVIYRPLLIPDLEKVVQAWRHEVAKVGLPGLWLVCAQTFGLVDPRPLGFDAAVEFPPHKINDRIEDTPPHGLWNPDFQGKTWQYADAVGEALTRDAQPYPLYRCAFPSWDNEARRPAAGFSFAQASPPQFGEWLATCASYVRETRPTADNFVFINAWNEWAEGAHLEPDRHFGYAWLEQVARQAEKPNITQVPRLIYGVPITPSASSARIAVVAHIYYEETWPDIAQALQALQEPFDLIITTTTDKLAMVTDLVTPQFAHAEIHAVDNKGRDIRPFVAVLPLLLERQYKAVLKLHSKKSLHRGDGDLWRQTLIAQLLPCGADLAPMINSLHEYPALGLIAPEGNVLNIQRYIGSNQAWVDKLVTELGENAQWLRQTKPWFAAGTMFWFKPQAVQSLLHCPSIQQDAFEVEKGQIDGTLAHAIERVLGCATLANGYHLIDTRLAKGIGSTDAKIRRLAQKDWSDEWSYKGRHRTVDSPFARPTETAS